MFYDDGLNTVGFGQFKDKVIPIDVQNWSQFLLMKPFQLPDVLALQIHVLQL